MIAAIRGFMPAVDWRLSIAIKSGAAAKVVPNPATKPKISDRLNSGRNRLWVSFGIKPWQPQSTIRLRKRTTRLLLSNLDAKAGPPPGAAEPALPVTGAFPDGLVVTSKMW